MCDYEKLDSRNPKIKYGFTKELTLLAQEQPETLYQEYGRWVEMLENPNHILQWTAIKIIGYLSAVDTEDKAAEALARLVRFLHSGDLIPCCQTIFTFGLFLRYKPLYKTLIIREFLEIQSDRFRREECREMAIGKVLEVVKEQWTELKNDFAIREFIEMAAYSPRDTTRRKAAKLLKKLGR